MESIDEDENPISKKCKIAKNSIERRLQGKQEKTFTLDKKVYMSHPLVLNVPEASIEFSPQIESCKATSSSSAKEAWKRRQGKFKLATPESETQYMWLPFFESLKEDPTRPEFVYLQPPLVPKSPKYDPYELEIVRHCHLRQHAACFHYTMSSKGVTLFSSNGNAEFEALDQWERAYNQFRCIMHLNIFSQYKIWKTWALWKHYVRRKKKTLASAIIQKNLFANHVIFADVLVKIRKIVVKIWTMRFYYLDPKKIYTLNEFIQEQTIKKNIVDLDISQYARDIIIAIKNACMNALAQLEESLLGTNDSSMSLPNEESENHERYTYLIAAAKRLEQSRLLSFVRLVDYLITDALHMVLKSTLEDLVFIFLNLYHNEVNNNAIVALQNHNVGGRDDEEDEHGSSRDSILMSSPNPQSSLANSSSTINESFDEDGKKVATPPQYLMVELWVCDEILVFHPSFQDYKIKIEGYVKDILNVVRVLRRMLYHPELDGVVDKGDVDVENLTSYVDLIGENQFHAILKKIPKIIKSSFKSIEFVKEPFQKHLDQCIANRLITHDMLLKEVEEGKRDLQMFRDDIEIYLCQENAIAHLPDYYDVGIFHIITAKAKQSLLPLPQQAKKIIFALLSFVAGKLLTDFMNKIHEAEKKLRVVPNSVESFVDIANFKDDLQKTLANLEDQSKSIVDHYELIKEYGMEVPAMEQASFQMMAVDFTSCKEAMDLVEDAKPLNIKKFSSDLSNEVNLLRKDVIDIRTSAQAPMILSASM